MGYTLLYFLPICKVISVFTGILQERLGSMKDKKPAFITQFRQLINDIGWINTVWYCVKRVLITFTPRLKLYRYILVAQPIPEEYILPLASSPFSIRHIAATEYQFGWFPRPASVILWRYEQSAQSIVAFHKGKAIGCLWYVLGPYSEDEVRCRFFPTPESTTAWDFDIYVDPKYRLGRTFIYLWSAANKRLKNNRIQWTMSRIDAFNPQSLRSHEKLGAHKIGSAVYICGKKTQLTLSTLPPYIHFSRNEKSIPTLRLKSPAIRE